MRRVSWASTSRLFSSRGLRTAAWMAALVISWKTIRCTGTLGLRTSCRCQAIVGGIDARHREGPEPAHHGLRDEAGAAAHVRTRS